MPERAYLDWNATAPLRPEARSAMIAAMDVVGNPSSVHTEGRAAKAIIEKAREQVASLVGCDREEVVFTSGATEAAALAVAAFETVLGAPVEHDCVFAHVSTALLVSPNGYIGKAPTVDPNQLIAVQAACGETGVIQPLDGWDDTTNNLVDATQALGKAAFSFEDIDAIFALASGHKFGGPKAVGALVKDQGIELVPQLRGGGQEKGRRSGTENVIGIAGFGAAAEAAQSDLEAGIWDGVSVLRDQMESALRDCAGDDITIFGENTPRLPNTSCFAIPGWKGETQVMQLDLAGFSVSAGSACSSGKVGPSRVLKAMGYDDITASSAIRVSMGPTTTKEEVARFIDAWTALYKKMKTRAA